MAILGTVNSNLKEQVILETRKKVEDSAMGDVRLAKFETLIESIDSKIKKNLVGMVGFWGIENRANSRNVGKTALALVFNYDNCNVYAQTIMNKSSLLLYSSNDVKHNWNSSNLLVDEYENIKQKIDASKEFVKLCREYKNSEEGYKFIFWALLILTVDKTNAEEHLSLICDFAKMLNITDEEFEDIIYIVKIIFGEADKEYEIKSMDINCILGPIINLVENKDI